MANYDLIGYGSGKIHKPSSSDHLRIGDTSRIKIGAGEDLEIYHDGSNSFLANETGALNIATLESGIAVNIGHGTSEVTIGDNLTVTGNLTVNGSTTTVNSTTLQVDDKNLELGTVDTPTDTTADGGGITLKGATDHTILWTNSTDSWDFSEHVNAATGKEFKINNVSVLSATTLGSSVVGSSLTSVGTIATGEWQATDVAVAHGGTGASTAAAARTNLGLAIGTDVQAYDAELAALAGLTSAADKGIQFTGDGTAATYDLTSAGKALLDDANASAQRTTLGLVIGTDVQAYDADLATLSGMQTGGAAALAALTSDEISILDGANVTTAELNIIDGDTTATSTTLVDADRIVVNDNGTMVQVALSDLATYVGSGGGSTANNALDASSLENISTNITIAAGEVVAIVTSGSDAGDISAADNNSYPEVIGVATSNITGTDTASSSTVSNKVHSAWGKKVNISKVSSDVIAAGNIIYLAATTGSCTNSAPTSDVVYRLGYAAEAAGDGVGDVDVIWMPQFIADLG